MSITNAVGDTTGSGAAASATIGFAIESVNLDTQGLGYRNKPTLSIDGTPTNPAVIDVTLNEQEGRVGSLTITDAWRRI